MHRRHCPFAYDQGLNSSIFYEPMNFGGYGNKFNSDSNVSTKLFDLLILTKVI
ncbi:unnamed protein product [Musa acuminata subsp. malaccensis]|uniref:(wild Malaysian banana) hypothetical protein n=1 Tax=Musa acuminata subsp. malaccensis TaxID=214687 RepID=A0A8D7B166_MUSAM|nr:unnamed protein product [Musa acuminata subsp. malaccensis]